jgi:hypothetical protein
MQTSLQAREELARLFEADRASPSNDKDAEAR